MSGAYTSQAALDVGSEARYDAGDMYTGFFDIFSIGIGPSSSHTMGPMRAAARFVQHLKETELLGGVRRVHVNLYGSLALTGEGHGTPGAVIYGLMGLDAEHADPAQCKREEGCLQLLLGGEHPIAFAEEHDILLKKEETLPEHPNGMRFYAYGEGDRLLLEETYFSVGGGSVRRAEEMAVIPSERPPVPYDFGSCDELMHHCRARQVKVAGLVMANECSLRPGSVLNARIRLIYDVMMESIERGIHAEGILPGSLGLSRRAPLIYRSLQERFLHNEMDPLVIVDWINLWAFAVSEENACSGRVVTAPTMGSSGVIPAVLRYFVRFGNRGSSQDCQHGIRDFLLTASAICSLYRANASISGAEVGCQGEVGVACSMAAAGLTAAMGGTNAQIENAAEIAMEHNLGLTCDPVCGLVQVPCIERNAIGAVKAVNAARLALRGDGTHFVSLDKVIRTMYETGRHLDAGYRETSLSGLAKNALTC